MELYVLTWPGRVQLPVCSSQQADQIRGHGPCMFLATKLARCYVDPLTPERFYSTPLPGVKISILRGGRLLLLLGARAGSNGREARGREVLADPTDGSRRRLGQERDEHCGVLHLVHFLRTAMVYMGMMSCTVLWIVLHYS